MRSVRVNSCGKERDSESNLDYFKDKELYLLRNLSRGKVIGFFEAGNFYPDFIMWVVGKGGQSIVFLDPKGLEHLKGLDDEKIRLHEKHLGQGKATLLSA